MTERRRYRNPPIEEALCEFQFEPGDEWDLTMPGKLHAKLEDAYPAKPKHQVLAQLDVQIEKGRPRAVRYEENVPKVQLLSADETRLVGIGPDTLSVHMLRPYQSPECGEDAGWGEFRGRIGAALRAYWAVAGPVGVRRVSIRYINKIVVPQEGGEISDYLRCTPADVAELPDVVTDFTSRVDYRYDDDVHLAVSQGMAREPSGHMALLLDLDVICEVASPLDEGPAMAKAQGLRDRERQAFEAVITGKARALFDAP